MIETTLLDGVISGLERTRRCLRRLVPRSPHPRQVAEILKEIEGLLAKLHALRAEGAGGEPEANRRPLNATFRSLGRGAFASGDR
jgi:hypothetical protein